MKPGFELGGKGLGLEYFCLLNIGDTLFPELLPRLCIVLYICGIRIWSVVDAKRNENLAIRHLQAHRENIEFPLRNFLQSFYVA